MSKPSLAEAVLTAVEELTPILRELYNSDCGEAGAAFQEGIRELIRLEEFAARRVELNTYEEHRRRMETCHVTLPKQATGD